MKLRILSFNIRYWKANDGHNNWENRKNMVAKVVHDQNPDIIGFQEVLKQQLDFLIDQLPEYEFIGVGRDNGKMEGEFAPIFYRKSFKVLESGNFWLSETPEVPSKSWSTQNRICTWGRISLRSIPETANSEILFANTHFGLNVDARTKSVGVIKIFLQKYLSQTPILLTGDFNFMPKDIEYQKISEFLVDSYLEVPENHGTDLISFHGYSGRSKPFIFKRNYGRIDYLWIKNCRKVLTCRILQTPPDKTFPRDVYPSDHYPLIAEIEL
jgi:endonuclease/exonuclease/phosphatase family metal-dependent hydrolase